jgi:hypothetical protein
MRPIWLIAMAFLRQQRIALAVLMFYVLFFAVVFTLIPHRKGDMEGFNVIFKQQATYGLLFSVFVCLSAVYQERKTRRILAVLSKGILRSEYLAGLMLGSAIFVAIYLVALGVSIRWFGYYFQFEPRSEPVLLATFVAALVGSALALVCGAVLHPYVAAAVCGVLIAVPGVIAKILPQTSPLFPVSHVFQGILMFDFVTGWQAGWLFVPIALLHLAAIWVVGSALFHRTDVTVAAD